VAPQYGQGDESTAPELPNVSRPFLIKLVNSGDLPFRRVGTHRRVLVKDVITYKQLDDARRREAVDALVAEAQELGLGS